MRWSSAFCVAWTDACAADASPRLCTSTTASSIASRASVARWRWSLAER